MRSDLSFQNPVFVRFVLVSLLFTAGMAGLLIAQVTNWWVWGLYITVWTYAEHWFAHGLKLGWLGWTVFFAILAAVDFSILFATGALP